MLTNVAVLQDFDLLEVEHGAVVDRNACIFCHVGIFRDRAFVIEQVSLQASHGHQQSAVLAGSMPAACETWPPVIMTRCM